MNKLCTDPPPSPPTPAPPRFEVVREGPPRVGGPETLNPSENLCIEDC